MMRVKTVPRKRVNDFSPQDCDVRMQDFDGSHVEESKHS